LKEKESKLKIKNENLVKKADFFKNTSSRKIKVQTSEQIEVLKAKLERMETLDHLKCQKIKKMKNLLVDLCVKFRRIRAELEDLKFENGQNMVQTKRAFFGEIELVGKKLVEVVRQKEYFKLEGERLRRECDSVRIELER
jgi:hypothetical protein